MDFYNKSCLNKLMFKQDIKGRSEFMPKAKYDYIYRDLKEKIETEYYTYQEMRRLNTL